MTEIYVKTHPFNPLSWISEIAQIEGTKLSSIVIPGTHHSGVDRLCQMRLLGCYAVCQQLSVLEQLEHGVRYINFNLCDDYDGDLLYVSHNFASKELWPQVEQIGQFLERHPQQIVVIDLKKDFDRNLSEKGITALLEGMKARLGRFGFVNLFNMNQPIKEHLAANRRVVLSLGFEGRDFREFGVTSLKSWAYTNSSSPQEVVQKNEGLFGDGFGQDSYPRFNVSQLVVTLDAPSILKLSTIRSKSMQLKQIIQSRRAHFSKANVVLLDYFQAEDFEWAMRLNCARLQLEEDRWPEFKPGHAK